MAPVEQLERQSEIADAKLGVAEGFSWPIAVLFAIAVHQQWGNWLATVVAGAAAFFIAIVKFKRAAASAEDAYYRTAKLGKYSSPQPNRET